MMDYLKGELNQLYGELKGEFCYLLFNVILFGCEIDCIVLKKDKIIILELKKYEGKINANCKEGEKWTIIDKDNNKYITKTNHCFDVRKRRGKMAKLLGELYELNEEDEKELLSFISAWVIVNENSRINITNLPINYSYWFKVLPINEVTHKIELETLNKFSLTDSKIKKLIQKLKLEKRNPDYWLHDEEVKIKNKQIEPEQLLLNNQSLTNLFKPFNDLISRYPDIKPTVEILNNFSSAILHQNIFESDFQSGNITKVKFAIIYSIILDLYQNLPLIVNHKNNPYEGIRELVINAIIHFDYENTNSILIEYLKDPSWKVRKKSLENLIWTGSPEISNILLDMLGDESKSEEEIYLIVKALSEVGDDRVIEPLIELNNNYILRFPNPKYGGYPKGFILSALGSIGSSKAIPFFKEFIFTDDDYIQELILDELGKINHPDSAEIILRFLDKKNPCFYEAIYALGEMGNKKYAKHLHKFINDRKLFSKVEYALEKINSKKSFDPIWNNFKKFIEAGKKEIAEHRIMKFLIKLNSVKMENRLLVNLKSKNKRLRNLARIFIPQVATIKSEKELLPFLKDPDNNTRYMISSALSNIYKDKIPQFVFNYLSSDNEYLRESAVFIIGYGLKKGELKHLEELRFDDSKNVRLALTHILSNIGDRKCLEYFIEMIKDDDWEVLDFVLNGLEKIGYNNIDPKVILPKLKTIQNHKSEEVRREVAIAYDKICTVECLDPLLKMSLDKDKLVSQISLQAINEIGRSKILFELNNLHLNPNQSIDDFKKYEKFGVKLLDLLENKKSLTRGIGNSSIIYTWENIVNLIRVIRDTRINSQNDEV